MSSLAMRLSHQGQSRRWCMSDEDDISQVVLETVNCPECKGRKKFTKYADGHGICFNKGCGYKEGIQPERLKQDPIPRGLIKPDAGSFQSIRSISPDTLRRYGAFLGGYKGSRQLVVPRYSDTGEYTGQQVRASDGQEEVLGDTHQGQLLGQHVYGDRNDKRVVIHSDSVDMMSTAQVTRLRMPCVSVLSKASALADIKANYRWLDRFAEIILFFQESPEWQKTAQEAASLFAVGKVKIALMGEYKSSNDALQQGKPGDIESAVYAATVWRPIGIVNAMDGRDTLFKGGLQSASWPYPWEVVNEKTMGMRPGECTYHVGGTGIAKTTLMFHYAVHLLKWEGGEFLPGFPAQPPCKIGWLGFEDMTKQVQVGMLGIYAKRMLSLEAIPEAEGVALYDDLFANRRLELYDPEHAEYGLEALFSYVRFMRRALDCLVFFIDPLTFLVSQLPAPNRTQEEDKLAGRLAAEAKAMGVHFHIGYHLRKPDGTPFEEGAQIGLPDIRGSGALTHFAHNVLAYERDQQGGRPDLLRIRSLKNRVARYTGEVCILKYDMDTGNYTPTDDEWPDKGNKTKKPSTRGGGQGGDY